MSDILILKGSGDAIWYVIVNSKVIYDFEKHLCGEYRNNTTIFKRLNQSYLQYSKYDVLEQTGTTIQ